MNDYVAIALKPIAGGTSTALDLSTFTIEAWISPTDSGRNVIVCKGDAATAQVHVRLWVNSAGKLVFRGRQANQQTAEAESNYLIPSGVFTHVAVVATPTKVSLFVNGVLDQETAIANAIQPIGHDLNIGRDLNDEAFSGLIKEVRVWNTARTAQELDGNRYQRFTGKEAGLVGYWPLTENPWGTLADLTSYKNDGMIGGSGFVTQPQWVYRDLVLDPIPQTGYGQGLAFDGVDQFLAAQHVRYSTLNALTVELWVKITEAREQALIYKGDRLSKQVQFRLWINSEQKLAFQAGRLIGVSTGTVPLHEPVHVCVSVTGTELRFYINGTSDSQPIRVNQFALKEAVTLGSDLVPLTDLYVGKSFDQQLFKGILREVRIWDVARSAAQIVQFMHRFVPIRSQGLVGYWRLDAIADGVAPDLTYNQNPLYLGGIAEDFRPDRVITDQVLPPQIAVPGAVLEFDGDNDVVVIRNANNWGFGKYERLTLEFWFNATDATLGDRKQVIVTQGDQEAGLCVYLFQQALHVVAWNNVLNIDEIIDPAALQQAAFSSEPVFTSASSSGWHHVAITLDEFHDGTLLPEEAIAFCVYLDGAALSTPEGKGVQAGLRLSPVGVAYLGGLAEGGTTCFKREPSETNPYAAPDSEHLYFFAGQLTELRLWQTARSPEQLQRDRHTPPADKTNLFVYLPLNDQRNLVDESGNAKNPHKASLQDRNIIFETNGKGIELENVFSHYYVPALVPDSITWANYIYSGRIYLSDLEGGIGVTFLSQYPAKDNRFYRLQRHHQSQSFHLVSHAHGFQPLDVTRNEQLTPLPNTWYRFEIQVQDTGSETRIVAQLWPDLVDDPAAPTQPQPSRIEAIDRSEDRLKSGTVGVWGFGAGEKRFDRLNVETIATPTNPAVVLLPDTNFERYSLEQDPLGWTDTSDRIDYTPQPNLFKPVVIDGNTAFGTDDESESVQSHYTAAGALNWTNYTVFGRLYMTDADSGIGLTFLSRYPEQRDQYYRLSRDRVHPTFRLSARPYGIQTIGGITDSGVVPIAKMWYHIRIRVEDRPSHTKIQAKVWPEGSDEPLDYQIDAHDDSDMRLSAGTVGLWAGGKGAKYIDNLRVVQTVHLSEQFIASTPGTDPANWLDTGAVANLAADSPAFRVVSLASNKVLATGGEVDIELNTALSHYTQPEAIAWTNYAYSGKLYLTEEASAIGITLLSRYPANEDRYYWLGYQRWRSLNTFHLGDRQAQPGTPSRFSGTVDSGVVPLPNTWYRFLAEVEVTDTETRINAKVWPDGTPEPAEFQIRAVDANGDRLLAGTIGVWASDRGWKYFNDLQVRRRGVLLTESFETQPLNVLPAHWRTFAPQTPPPSGLLYKTVKVGTTTALGTEVMAKELSACYIGEGALGWKDYVYAGRMLISTREGDIGINLLCQYSNKLDRCYRIDFREANTKTGRALNQFNLVAITKTDSPATEVALKGKTNAGFEVLIQTWYRFYVEVRDTGTRTEIRAKIWQDGTPEPADFSISAYDDRPGAPNGNASRLTTGTVGVWGEDKGLKCFDDLQVVGPVLYSESFESSAVGDRPRSWKDTKLVNTYLENSALFKTAMVSGSTALSAVLNADSSYSHYIADGALEWNNYTFVGRFQLNDLQGAIGVTFLSQYPAGNGRYYRLRYGNHTAFNSVFLEARPLTAAGLQGRLDSGVAPSVNTWYWFRIDVQDGGDRTLIRAKLWPDGSEEPNTYQIEAFDQRSDRLTKGTVGVWAADAGVQSFDSLQVLHGVQLWETFEPDANQPTDQPTGQPVARTLTNWLNTRARSLFTADDTLFKTTDVNDNRLRWVEVTNLPILRRPLSRHALQFNGQQEYAAALVQPPLALPALTLEAWVKLDRTVQEHPILCLRGTNAKQETVTLWFGVHVNATAQNFKLSVLDRGDVIRLIAPPQAIQPDRYTFVAVRLEPKPGSAIAETEYQVSFYVSGQAEVSSSENLPKATLPLSVTAIELGRNLGTQYCDGQIKEVRLWNVARSNAQITAIADQYQQPNPATEPHLVGHWNFDEGSGDLVLDDTVGNYHLRLGGLTGARQPQPALMEPKPDDFWRASRRGFEFNGVDTIVSRTDTSATGTKRPRRTVELWFLVDDKTISSRKQVLYQEGDGDRGLNLYIYDGKLYAGGYNLPTDESGWAGTWLHTNRIESGRWHHVALVLDGRAEVRDRALALYVDGKWVNAGSGSQLWNQINTFSLGAVSRSVRFHDGKSVHDAASSGAHVFKGQLLELRLWNVARSAADLARYRYSSARAVPGWALWWNFDEWNFAQSPTSQSTISTGTVQHHYIRLRSPYQLPAIALDPSSLSGLAQIKQLKAATNWSIDRLISLWSTLKHIGTADQKTLFDQTFNDSPAGLAIERWLPYLDEPIRWDKTGQEDRQRSLQTRTRLLNALQTTDADLNTLLLYLSGTETIIDMDRSYLTTLYRLVQLAKLLQLPLADALKLLDLTAMKATVVTTSTSMYLRSLDDPSANAAVSPSAQLLAAVQVLCDRVTWLTQADLTVQHLSLLLREVTAVETLAALVNRDSVQELAVRLASQLKEVSITSDSFADLTQLNAAELVTALKTAGFIDEFGLPTPEKVCIVRPDSFVSDRLFASQSTALFSALQATGLVDPFGAITDLYQDATSLESLLSDQVAQAQVASVLQAIRTANRDLGLAIQAVLPQPLPAADPDQTQALQDQIQDTVSNRLEQARNALTDGLWVGLADVLAADPVVVEQAIAYLQRRGDWAWSYLFQQIASLKEVEPIPLGVQTALAKLTKLLILVDTFTLSTTAFRYHDAATSEVELFLKLPSQSTTQLANVFGIIDVLQPTLSDLEQLVLFKQLKQTFVDPDTRLIQLLVLNATQINDFKPAIAALTGWETAQLDRLYDYFDVSAIATDRNKLLHFQQSLLTILNRCQRCLSLSHTTQLDLDSLTQLAASDEAFATYRTQAAALLNLWRSRYSEQQWPTLYKPVRDPLAVKQRDALLAVAMQKLGAQFEGRKDPDILYEYFLLDMQMGSEVDTSRLVQATASLQLYVQRCLMNLERGVDPSKVPLKEWEWVKNYRVWEANRKVFLYPENYIEPELRREKTPLFKALEDELMQSSLSQDSVEQAYVNYLNGFREVATLKVVGSYYDEGLNEAGQAVGDRILYLVGCTDTDPKMFYYREYNDSKKQWQPWKKIDLAINSNFAAPVVAFNKLFLFWTEFKKVSKSVDRKPKTVEERTKAQNEKLLDAEGYH